MPSFSARPVCTEEDHGDASTKTSVWNKHGMKLSRLWESTGGFLLDVYTAKPGLRLNTSLATSSFILEFLIFLMSSQLAPN
jgi:hypothetical protein